MLHMAQNFSFSAPLKKNMLASNTWTTDSCNFYMLEEWICKMWIL